MTTALALAALVAGCGGGALPWAHRGDCTLELAIRDPEAGSVRIHPPYVVGMTAETPTGVRTARVDYVASGWQDAEITVRSPDGVNVASAIRWFDRSSWGQGFDRPGMWTIRWVDTVADCVEELSVLVLS